MAAKLAFFRREPPAIPVEFLDVVRHDYGAFAPEKGDVRALGGSVEALRGALDASEALELIVAADGGIIAVTDLRLIWISRGKAHTTTERRWIRLAEITPGAKLGYELAFKSEQNGGTLGRTIVVHSLSEADRFRRAVAPNAASKVVLAPEDRV